MHVEVLGNGPRLVLVHGSVQNSATWRPLRPLANRYTLVLLDRPGYPPNPPLDRIDFETQAAEIAELLEPRSHLLGFSYGGVISLLAAARRPDQVRSLTVIEPPCLGIAADHPAVAALIEEFSALWASGVTDPQEFLAGFSRAFGEAGQVPATVPAGHEQGVLALMAERPPSEAEIPFDDLRDAPFPALVCSSGAHPAYETVCDVLAAELGAERAILPGGGHAVHRAPGFVERFVDFLERAP